MTGRMAWSACDSGTARSFTSRKAGTEPTRAEIAGRSHSSDSPRYSTGTPGSATSSPRPSRTEKPGAVPKRFAMTVAPRGKRACLALLGVISRPNLRKRSRMASSDGRSSSSGTPMAAATTSAVRSSSVGPRPPLMTTRSERPVVSRMAESRSSRSSETSVFRRAMTPRSQSRSMSQAELVSTICPVRSSSPVARSSTCNGAPGARLTAGVPCTTSEVRPSTRAGASGRAGRRPARALRTRPPRRRP